MPPRGGLLRALEPAWTAGLRPLAPLGLPRDRPEQDLDLDLLLFAILKHHDLVEPFLRNRLLALLKGLKLALDYAPAHGTLPLFVTLDACL